MRLKQLIKSCIPPIFLSFLNKPRHSQQQILWAGNYPDWHSVVKKSTGYGETTILEKVNEAMLKLKNGDAAYERDSIVSDTPFYSWPLVTALLKCAAEHNNTLEVFDFGGSLGTHYFGNKAWLGELNSLTWNVIEQSNYVEYGNRNFVSDQLKFYQTLEECVKENNKNILIVSGSVQYLEQPERYLQLFVETGFDYIVFDRTSFVDSPDKRLTLQTVPEEIYLAAYPCWFFNYDKFVRFFESKYKLLSSFDPLVDPPMMIDDEVKGYWLGLIFIKKEYQKLFHG